MFENSNTRERQRRQKKTICFWKPPQGFSPLYCLLFKYHSVTFYLFTILRHLFVWKFIFVPHLVLLLISSSQECVFVFSNCKTIFKINALHWFQKIQFHKYQIKLSRAENMTDLVVREFQINHRIKSYSYPRSPCVW